MYKSGRIISFVLPTRAAVRRWSSASENTKRRRGHFATVCEAATCARINCSQNCVCLGAAFCLGRRRRWICVACSNRAEKQQQQCVEAQQQSGTGGPSRNECGITTSPKTQHIVRGKLLNEWVCMCVWKFRIYSGLCVFALGNSTVLYETATRDHIVKL